eukprot:4073907-Pyramimonas_sp.AAC.2
MRLCCTFKQRVGTGLGNTTSILIDSRPASPVPALTRSSVPCSPAHVWLKFENEVFTRTPVATHRKSSTQHVQSVINGLNVTYVYKECPTASSGAARCTFLKATS